MYGISATTGRKLDGLDHLRQSIRDILTTPIGSRVMRRTYGSRLFDLIDTPYNASTKLAIIAATAEALLTWEPRVEIDTITLTSYEPGHVTIALVGRYVPLGTEITIEGIDISATPENLATWTPQDPESTPLEWLLASGAWDDAGNWLDSQWWQDA